MANQSSTKNYNKLIWVISILIPIAVAGLYYIIPELGYEKQEKFRVLAHINAVINSLTALVLIMAVIAIKKGNQALHKKLMISAIVLGGIFLLNYVALHSLTDHINYPKNSVRPFYIALLASHILLSIIVLPFVLITLARGLNGMNEKHKKIAKFAFPIWLYVSVSGVIVYFMISQYYPA